MEYSTSDELYNEIKYNLFGGNKICGTRKMIIYSDFSEFSGGNSESSSSTGSEVNLHEIEEIIEKQTKEIHENIIKEIMKNKNIDRDSATKIKDELYEKVSKLRPELNDYDRAVEMTKIINDKELSRHKKKKS